MDALRQGEAVEEGGDRVLGSKTEPLLPIAACPYPMVLIVGEGPEARRRPLGRRTVCIGTAGTNDLVLHDRTVSAYHCRFETVDRDVLVCDLGSRNGTWVDGVRVESARVAPGARLRLGRTDLRLLARQPEPIAKATGIVTASAAMLTVLSEIERLARLRWPALIRGESGTGKELVARALHDRGPRAEGPFVALNAGGLPKHLIESELFGHEKGSFTGAVVAHRGVFEQAHGGTLFMDEIAELPLDMQARLLRVLETWEIRRVGAESSTLVDVRLVCATHQDLAAMVTAGSFRLDLYYRIARLALDLPPLRDRASDIDVLIQHFLDQLRDEVGPRSLADDARTALLAYRWPGNVRELRNVLAAAAVNSCGQVITADDVVAAMGKLATAGSTVPSAAAMSLVLGEHGGNLSAAARALGIPRTTLRDKLKPRQSVGYGGTPRGRVAQRMTKPA